MRLPANRIIPLVWTFGGHTASFLSLPFAALFVPLKLGRSGRAHEVDGRTFDRALHCRGCRRRRQRGGAQVVAALVSRFPAVA